MSSLYKSEIEKDYDQVKNIITDYYKEYDLNYESIFKGLEITHLYFYYFRDLAGSIDYVNRESINALNDFYEGVFDFFWLMVSSRYKSATITIRSAFEMLIKSYIREVSPEYENNKFSNNLEKLIKEFCIQNNFSKNKNKKIKKHLNDIYSETIKKQYKELSNITHGNYISDKLEFNEYLIQILNIKGNYKEEEFKNIISLVNKTLLYCLELFIILNFKELDKNMNSVKLSLIMDNLSSNLEKFREIYIE